VSGHDFSRAAQPQSIRGLQPLRAFSSFKCADPYGYSSAEFANPAFTGLLSMYSSMLLEALLIIDAFVGESALPNLASKLQFLVCPERKTTFDQLHCLFKTHLAGYGHQKVNVVRHDDKVVNNDSSWNASTLTEGLR
jgi:hypothetical protein